MTEETRRIVEWLREAPWPYRNDALIAAIERGDHLKDKSE